MNLHMMIMMKKCPGATFLIENCSSPVCIIVAVVGSTLLVFTSCISSVKTTTSRTLFFVK